MMMVLTDRTDENRFKLHLPNYVDDLTDFAELFAVPDTNFSCELWWNAGRST